MSEKNKFNLMFSDISWIILEEIEWKFVLFMRFLFHFFIEIWMQYHQWNRSFWGWIWLILLGNIRIILSHFSVYFVHFSLYLFPQINNIILVYCSKGCYLSVEFVLKGIWRHFHPSFYQCHFRLFLMVMVKIGWIYQLIM